MPLNHLIKVISKVCSLQLTQTLHTGFIVLQIMSCVCEHCGQTSWPKVLRCGVFMQVMFCDNKLSGVPLHLLYLWCHPEQRFQVQSLCWNGTYSGYFITLFKYWDLVILCEVLLANTIWKPLILVFLTYSFWLMCYIECGTGIFLFLL